MLLDEHGPQLSEADRRVIEHAEDRLAFVDLEAQDPRLVLERTPQPVASRFIGEPVGDPLDELAEGLMLCDLWPLESLALSIRYLAGDVERGEPAGWLTVGAFECWLTTFSGSHAELLLERLEGARQPFWRALAVALGRAHTDPRERLVLF